MPTETVGLAVQHLTDSPCPETASLMPAMQMQLQVCRPPVGNKAD
eukprot:SAG31_NODE_37421_length_304_cov_1.000000_2_plen_44_part_01